MKFLGVALAFFSLSWVVVAQSNPTLEATNLLAGARLLSLQDCIQLALKHNLDVQIQRYNPEIDLYNLRASYGGYDPTAKFSANHEYLVQPSGFTQQGIPLPAQTTTFDSYNASIGGALPVSGLQYNFLGNIDEQTFLSGGNIPNSGGSIGVQLTQPLLQNLWIDQTRLTIKQNKNALQQSQQAFREQVITSVNAVQTAYYQLIYDLENVKVQQEALDLSQTQLDQDKQRMQIGTLALLSVQQDESQVAQNRAALIAAESKAGTGELTLKTLLTDNYPTWQGVEVQPTEPLAAPLVLFNLEDSWSKAMTERPDLLQARLKVESQGIQLKFDRNQLFPSLDLVGTAGYNGEGVFYGGTFDEIDKGNAPYYSYGIQLSVPLANQSARNTYKSAKVTLQQVALQMKQMEQNIMVQVENAIGTARSDYESVQATRDARVYAEAALDAEQKTYSVGKATTFEVLQYQSQLTTARGNEIQALSNYEQDLANLAAAEGSTLDKLGITIEAE
jgi:HAE1 family hydrophobic/amphiphilic exporter-1